MTKKELQKLKKLMPKDYRQTLADEFDISTGYVDQIFRATKVRSDVIDQAIKIATMHQEYLKELSNKIKKL